MEIQSFHAIVNLEFLLVLSNVFMSALANDESVNRTPLALQQPSQATSPKGKSTTVNTTDEEPPQITVQISIKDPEIVLLADARDRDTNALFLKVSKLHTIASIQRRQTPFGVRIKKKRKSNTNTNTNTLEFFRRKQQFFFHSHQVVCAVCV